MILQKYFPILFILIFFCFSISKVEAQNQCSISGNLRGAGTGKKIYLGNKANGIGPGFTYIIYDSTLTRNDSFYFKPLKFTYVSDYSIEAEGVAGWVNFLIDEGNIIISGNKDSIYKSKIIGSGNEDLSRKFYKELYRPWDKEYFAMMARLPKGNNIDSNLYKHIVDSMSNFTSEYRKKIIDFYKENVNTRPYVAFRVLRMATIEIMPDSVLQGYFEMLPKEVQTSYPLEDVHYRLNGFKENIQVGRQIPDFTFFAIEKKSVNLYKIEAKYKLIVFWASWCAPCLAEIPVLDSFYQRNKIHGLKILSVNVDNSEFLWKKNISKYSFDCVHLYQGGYSSSPMYKYFNVSSIPFMVLLDSKNRIIKYNIQIDEVSALLK